MSWPAAHEVPVIVDLWAPWCGPCTTLGPMLERAVAATDGAVELAKVNVDDNPRIAQSFAVQSIPAVFAIGDGKVADQFIGALPEPQVVAFVQKLLPALSEADTLAAAGDEASLRRALELEPGHQQATEALARILIDRGEAADALALLARVPETPAARSLAAEARLVESGVNVAARRRRGRRPAECAARTGAGRRRGPPGVRGPARDARGRGPAHQLVPPGPGHPPLLIAPATTDNAAPRPMRPPRLMAPAGPAHTLDLGGRRHDLTHRGLVMGILNRTPDSFYDKGATFALDAFYARAEALVADGADILDVGGVKAGPGSRGHRGRGDGPGRPRRGRVWSRASRRRCRSTPGGPRSPGPRTRRAR